MALTDNMFEELLGFNGGTGNTIRDSVYDSLTKDVTNYNYVQMKKICCRYQNWYICDPNENKKLVQSIREDGLVSPIVLVNIERYLNTDLVPDNEKNYLEKMQEEYGCRYFIVSGHRRFRACLEIEFGKPIERRKDILAIYADKTKDPTIRAIIIEPTDADQGERIYNDANITNRGGVSAIEILINEEAVFARQRFRAGNHKKITNKELQEYIFKKDNVRIPDKTIEACRILTNTRDDDFLELIFEGKLTVGKARKVAAYYSKLNENEKREFVEKVWNGEKITTEGTLSTTISSTKISWSKEKVLKLLSSIKMELPENDKEIVEKYLAKVTNDSVKF